MKSFIKVVVAIVAIISVTIAIVSTNRQLHSSDSMQVEPELVEPSPSLDEVKEETKKETHEEIIARLVADVDSGKAGNGSARKEYLGEYYSEVQAIINKKYKTVSKPKTTSRSNTATKATSGSKLEYQNYAHDLVIQYGWSEEDFNALINLWNRESGWNPNAHNKSSGAHGIPQALPASKMASEGSDYYTNAYTQIRWGLKYIKNRYGSPSNAWAHSQRKGWY